MTKGIIYYTDNRMEDPIKSAVEHFLLEAKLPIISCSLQPLAFGQNIVLPLQRGYPTYIRQIITALETSEAEIVYFCEHDVLYPPSHFDFTPECDSIFYYNDHVWRWLYGSPVAITYDRLFSLSGLCVDRKFALEHYQKRWAAMEKIGLDQFTRPEPQVARLWGYEPGAKKKKRGGFSDEDFSTWKSAEPLIDIRHRGTMTQAKVTLESFKHAPTNWKEIPIEEIPGWNLKQIFDL